MQLEITLFVPPHPPCEKKNIYHQNNKAVRRLVLVKKMRLLATAILPEELVTYPLFHRRVDEFLACYSPWYVWLEWIRFKECGRVISRPVHGWNGYALPQVWHATRWTFEMQTICNLQCLPLTGFAVEQNLVFRTYVRVKNRAISKATLSLPTTFSVLNA